MSTLEWRKAYNKANPEKGRAAQARYRLAHPDRRAERERQRRARLRGVQIGEAVYISELIEAYGDTCMFPGCESKELTVDHIKPISKGGSHEFNNMQLLCGPHNSSKGNRVETDYRPGVQIG